MNEGDECGRCLRNVAELVKRRDGRRVCRRCHLVLNSDPVSQTPK